MSNKPRKIDPWKQDPDRMIPYCDTCRRTSCAMGIHTRHCPNPVGPLRTESRARRLREGWDHDDFYSDEYLADYASELSKRAEFAGERPPYLIRTFKGDEATGRPQSDFEQFHEQNPEIYVKLRDMARQAILNGKFTRKGGSQISMKGIWEDVRNWCGRTTDPKQRRYGLNNDYHADYARLLMQENDWLKGRFETRKRKGEA